MAAHDRRDLGRLQDRLFDATVRELAQETAASLGRAGLRLERAIEALAKSSHSTGPSADRDRLLDEAGEALYFYIVQREACGFRDSAEILHEFRVPPEVRLRMGRRRRAGPDDHAGK